MSAFGFSPKDEVVDAIKLLAEEEFKRGKTPKEIIESIMDATMCGIRYSSFDLKDEKVHLK